MKKINNKHKPPSIAAQSERIQKALANLGLGSRREIEGWIAEGRIKINDQLATLGAQVDIHRDRIQVDNKLVRPPRQQQTKTRVIIYNKPEGEICTRHDPEARQTVFAKLPLLKTGRWISIGRLDINSSGLLLFTNDGELANKLMHPAQQIEREYAVRVLGEVDKAMMQQLRRGVQLEDGLAKFSNIQFAGSSGANSWYHVTLSEGRNREVRRMWQAVGIQVSRLIRLRFGEITLPRNLPRGDWRELPIAMLQKMK